MRGTFLLPLAFTPLVLAQSTFMLTPRNPVVDRIDSSDDIRVTSRAPGQVQFTINDDRNTGVVTLTLAGPPTTSGFVLGGLFQSAPPTPFQLTRTSTGFQTLSVTLAGFSLEDQCTTTAASSTCTLKTLPISTDGVTIFVPFGINFRVAGQFSRNLSVTGAFIFGFGGGEDRVKILAIQPEGGTKLVEGDSPPFFAFVEYELATQEEGEVFLELTNVDTGTVIATSSSVRARKGTARVGSGIGPDPFLVIDDRFKLESSLPPLAIRAWLGDRGGRSRLKSSDPVVFTVAPAPKLRLELGVRSFAETDFKAVNPSTQILLAGRSIGFEPGGVLREFRATLDNETLAERDARLEIFGKRNTQLTLLGDRGGYGVEGAVRFQDLYNVDVRNGFDAYAFRARFTKPETGQVIFSDFIDLPVEWLELKRPISPSDGQNEGDSYLTDFKLEKGAAHNLVVPLIANVVRDNVRLYVCIDSRTDPDAGKLDDDDERIGDAPDSCEDTGDVIPKGRRQISWDGVVTPAVDANKAQLSFYLRAPRTDVASGGFLYYGVKDRLAELPAGGGNVVQIPQGEIRTAANATPRPVTASREDKTLKFMTEVGNAIGLRDPAQVLKGNPLGGKGAEADPSEILPLRASWRFTPTIPQDGTFAADLVLRYNPGEVPDVPGFDESKIQVLAVNQRTGRIEKLDSTVNVAERTVTARVNSLDELYGLGVVARRTSAQHAFPAAQSGGFLGSQLSIVNTGSEAVTLGLTPHAAGRPVANPNLPPRSQFNGNTLDTFANAEVTWVEARAGRDSLAGVQLRRNGTGLAAFPMAREGANQSLLPLVDSAATQLHIVNPGNFENQFSAYLYRPDGTLAESAQVTLGPKGKYFGGLGGLFRDLPERFSGYLLVSSGDPLSVAAEHTYARSSAVSAAQAVPETPGGQTVQYAQVLTGGKLYLVNAATSAAGAVLSAFQDTGATVGSPVNVDLAAGAQSTIDLATAFGLSAETPGWMRVQSTNGAVIGEVHFGDHSPAQRSRAVLPLVRALSQTLVIPLVAHNAQTQTMLAVAAPGGSSNVRVTVVNPSGATVGSSTASLTANARTERTLTQWAAQAGNLAAGYALIEASGPVMAYATLAQAPVTDIAVFAGVTMPGGASTGTPPAATAPAITVTPSSLAFGSVATGQTRELTFTIRNTGNGPLEVRSIDPSNARYTLTRPAVPFTVAAGGSQEAAVRFAPTAAGAQNGTLTINTNDPVQPAVSVILSGTGGAAAAQGLELTPDRLDFGTVTTGETRDLTVRVNNRASTTFAVNSITSSNARFGLVRPSTPFNIGGGSFQDFVIRFSPTASGALTGMLTLATTDPARPSLTVPVSGTGAGGTTPPPPPANAPVIAPSVTALDFGTVAAGQIKDLSFLVNNTGNANLEVTAIRSSNPRFTLLRPSLPFTVGPASFHDPVVRFSPATGAAETGTLTIASNDPARPTVSISLSGNPGGGAGGGAGGTGTNLLCNGSFEQPGHSTSFITLAVGGNLPCWSITAGNIDLIGTAWQSSNGSFSLDMNGDTAGTITQVFPTVSGTTYTVAFDMAGNFGGGETTKQLQVSAAGQSSVKSFVTTGRNASNMGWQQQTFTFTANSSSTTLQFRSLEPANSNAGPALDNVCVATGSEACSGSGTGGGTGGGGGGGGGGGTGGGTGTSTQVTPLTAVAWPNGRLSGNLPAQAIDGNINTFTWSTEAFASANPSYLGLDLGPAKAISRIRLYKDNDSGGAGPISKNLVIEYSTSAPGTPLPSRVWTRVTGLANGFRGAEPMTAQAVNADGTVAVDSHNSVATGAWATLSFNRVNATAIRVGFSNHNPPVATFQNHYRVYEFQVYDDGGPLVSSQVPAANVVGWPNGRVSNNRPPLAIDGDTNTFTWTTEAFNVSLPSYLGLDFGQSQAISRIRLFKDSDGGGGQTIKNLTIEFTTSDPSMPLPNRTWTAVSGLTNGLQGAELLTAQAVNANGTVTGDTHNSLTSGAWASLTFNRVNATGIRIAFANPGGASFVNHYKVHEFQVYNDGAGGGGGGGTTPTLREATLSVDDGTYETNVGFPNGLPLIYFVNRLTPPSYPATLKRIRIFFGNAADDLAAGHPITVVAGSNPGGGAVIDGITFQRSDTAVASRGSFNDLTLATPITINSGDFVVGFSTANPAGRFPMAADETTKQQRSYLSANGTAFAIVDTLGVAANFAIRAVVDVP